MGTSKDLRELNSKLSASSLFTKKLLNFKLNFSRFPEAPGCLKPQRRRDRCSWSWGIARSSRGHDHPVQRIVSTSATSTMSDEDSVDSDSLPEEYAALQPTVWCRTTWPGRIRPALAEAGRIVALTINRS